MKTCHLKSFHVENLNYSPDSVGTIMGTASRDTNDLLARFGYYDQAMCVARWVGCLVKEERFAQGVFFCSMMH